MPLRAAAAAHWCLRCSVGATTVIWSTVRSASNSAATRRANVVLPAPGVATARKSRGLVARYLVRARRCHARRELPPELLAALPSEPVTPTTVAACGGVSPNRLGGVTAIIRGLRRASQPAQRTGPPIDTKARCPGGAAPSAGCCRHDGRAQPATGRHRRDPRGPRRRCGRAHPGRRAAGRPAAARGQADATGRDPGRGQVLGRLDLRQGGDRGLLADVV